MTVSTNRSAARAHAASPLGLPQNLWRHRELILQLTRREIQNRYRGAFLGMFWSLAQPIFMLLIYTLVFGLIFRSRWPRAQSDGLGEFALIVFCGLIAFGLFSECATRAPGLITQHPNYVKKVVFPLEVLPLSALGAAFFQLGVSLSVLLAAQLALRGFIPWTVVLAPLVLLPAVFLSLGIMWLLASLGVFVRDISQAIGIVVQALFFMTPIFYSPEVVPAEVRGLIQANPLAWVVENMRGVALWGEVPNVAELGGWLLGTGAIMLLGYAWFMQTKKAFADVL